jgi:hypothetical protein
MRFQVLFKRQSFVLVGKGAVPNQLPRLVLSGVAGFAGIVFLDSPLQIFRGADVFLVGKFNASENVDVPH